MLMTENSTGNSFSYQPPHEEIFRRISNSARSSVIVDAVAQAAFNEKKWVWVEDKDAGYIAGYITKEMGEQVEVRCNVDSVSILFFF